MNKNSKSNEAINDRFDKIKKQMTHLQTLKSQFDSSSDAFVRDTITKEMGKRAKALSKAVKKFIKKGGDPHQLADIYKLSDEQRKK